MGAVVLTDELAQRMVKQSYGITIDAVDVEPVAIQTLLEATHKENMTISTSATPDFCWTHIQNSVCNTDIWDCNEGCDTGEF